MMGMKVMNIINQRGTLLTDMMAGIEQAYPQLKRSGHTRGFSDRAFHDQHIALVSGGGSGHEPADWGFVGDGMLTGAIMGEVFTPPTAEEIVAFVNQITGRKQVFFIVKNFAADVASFTVAKQKLTAAGWKVGMCIVADDVSVNNVSLEKRRRGVAGTVLVSKILGEAVRNQATLTELNDLAEQLLPEIKTIGVAFSGSYIPGSAQQTFYLADDEIFYGAGIHGEPGYRKEKFQSSELLADELVKKLKLNFRWQDGEQYAVLLNSLGGITTMESMIFNNDVLQLLGLDDLAIAFDKVGTFMAANGMRGLSLTLLRVRTESWLTALNAPVNTPAWS